MRSIRPTIAALVLLLLVAACTPQAQSTPTTAPPKPTPAPTAMPSSAMVPTAAPTVAAPTSAPTTVPVAAASPTAMAAASPTAEATVSVVNDAKLGPILTDAKGMTLYRFTKDQADTSNCYDQCAQNWPPLLVSSGALTAKAGLPGSFGLTTRKDGAKQATYNGMPLYYWVKDAKAGDTTGQGVNEVWYVVRPGEFLAANDQPIVKTATDPGLGEFLTDAKGWTLYVYTKDGPDTTNCYDQCAQNWPPLMPTGANASLASGVPGKLGTITRKDGTKQLTYNGIPLYYWVKDAKAGDTTGQGVGNVWLVVKPAAP